MRGKEEGDEEAIKTPPQSSRHLRPRARDRTPTGHGKRGGPLELG